MNNAPNTNEALVASNKALREALSIYIDSIEEKMHAKSELQADIRDKYLEAKVAGIDPKVLKAVIKRRAMDQDEVEEMDMLLKDYEEALNIGLFTVGTRAWNDGK